MGWVSMRSERWWEKGINCVCVCVRDNVYVRCDATMRVAASLPLKVSKTCQGTPLSP